jgi:phage/plasmid-like protein (TIGR03299 family)
MAHEIATDVRTGQSMYMGNQAAWHNLGQIVTAAVSWDEAMRLAHLDWAVVKEQLQSTQGELVSAWGVFREDTRQFLGAVGSAYHPMQNRYIFDMLDSLLEAESGSHYESAGALGSGERVFVLAKVAADFCIKGTDDMHKTYLLGVTAHDGSMASRFMLTDERVVCANTLNAALSRDGHSALAITHTKNADKKLAQAKKLIASSHESAMNLQKKLDTLAERQLEKSALVSIIDRLFKKEAEQEKEQELSKHSEKVMLKVLELFESNDNNAFPQIRGTAYNLLNAFTQFYDHENPVQMTQARKDARVSESTVRSESALVGLNASRKQDVLDIILNETKSAPTLSLSRTYSTGAAEQVIELEETKSSDDSTTSLLDEIIDSFPGSDA